MITAITGPLAAYGAAYQQGFEAGLDYAPTGPARSRTPTSRSSGSTTNPDTAVTQAEDLIGRGFQILGRSAASGVALAVAEHPAVAGVPSERWGEELVALARARRAGIADFTHAKRFLLVDQTPRTSSGQPLRRALTAAFQAERADAR